MKTFQVTMEQLVEIFELGRQIGHEEKLCHANDYPHESCHQRLAAKLTTIIETHTLPETSSPTRQWSQFRYDR